MITQDGTPAGSVSGQLKARTTDHHHRAERSRFQQDLVKGRVTRREYADWLGQLLCLFRGLEAAWVEAGLEARYPDVGLRAWGRTAALESDLRDLGDDAVAPRHGAGTDQFVAYLRRLGGEHPAGLLGVVYVLEGSTNGSVYIARAIRAGLGLVGGKASAYLDPYGDGQRVRWAEFKAALDRVDEAGSLPIMIEAAQATFDAMAQIGEELRGNSPQARG